MAKYIIGSWHGHGRARTLALAIARRLAYAFAWLAFRLDTPGANVRRCPLCTHGVTSEAAISNSRFESRWW